MRHTDTVSPWRLFAVGFALALAVSCHDAFVLGMHWMREGMPEWSAGNIARSAAFLGASLCMVASVFRYHQSRVALCAADAATGAPATPLLRIATQLLAIVGLACAGLLPHSPVGFSRLAQEDGLVESASAFFASIAAISGFALGWSLRRHANWLRLEIAGIFVFGLCCFMIAGEEVSWLQRVFEWHPAFVDSNSQKETNLHNFSTNKAENFYYFFGGFVALVLLPIVRLLGLQLGRLTPLVALMPPAVLIRIGALACAFNVDMYMGVPTQVAFWVSVAILAALALHCRDTVARWEAWAWLFLVLAVQANFLAFGHLSARSWDVTEYKELLIPAALFLWSIDLWRLRGKVQSHNDSPIGRPLPRRRLSHRIAAECGSVTTRR